MLNPYIPYIYQLNEKNSQLASFWLVADLTREILHA